MCKGPELRGANTGVLIFDVGGPCRGHSWGFMREAAFICQPGAGPARRPEAGKEGHCVPGHCVPWPPALVVSATGRRELKRLTPAGSPGVLLPPLMTPEPLPPRPRLRTIIINPQLATETAGARGRQATRSGSPGPNHTLSQLETRRCPPEPPSLGTEPDSGCWWGQVGTGQEGLGWGLTLQ